ncbi:MAG: YigZ family protein [candidate division Zixibacteria bacterium]|nr:YigZ family protein [candidate division Zixibacteria bacterium]
MRPNINNNDLFLQIKEPYRGEHKIKGSRFIATVRKVTTEEEAKAAIEEIKKEFHDATHNCYAWKVGHGKKARYRYADDGEPNNTAGLPILKTIDNRRLSNILVVVTRYFGGVKLGTGGLIRSYSKATMDALKECEIERSYMHETVIFKTSFDFVNLVHKIIATFRATLKDSSYGEQVLFTVDVRSSKYKEFKTKLKDGTNGQVEFVR